MCIFSAHSVIRDPPFSRLDLISCRNLMIYLKPGLQAQIIPLFHYALRPSGYLFLGSSENVSRHSELYTSLDRKSRIFRRRDLATRPPLALQQFLPQTRREAAGPEENNSGLLKRSDSLRRAANTIVEHFAPTFVIVDEIGQTLDVTNLVAAEEQQKVPAAELSHRVKNTLAVVSSIAERTLSDDDAKKNLIGRLHALGHTHDVLSEAGWREAGLRELISAELSPHGAGDGTLQVSGPPVMLRPQPLCLSRWRFTSFRPTLQNMAHYRFLAVGSRSPGSSPATGLHGSRSIGRRKVDQRSTVLGRQASARNLSSAVFVSNYRVRQS